MFKHHTQTNGNKTDSTSFSGKYLIHTDWFPIKLDHVKNLDGLQQKTRGGQQPKIRKKWLLVNSKWYNTYIVSIFFTPEFNKPITLVLVGHSVLRNIDINLNKQRKVSVFNLKLRKRTNQIVHIGDQTKIIKHTHWTSLNEQLPQ